MSKLLGDDYLRCLRRNMVSRQLSARNIANGAVLRAMGEVPRHLFVPPDLIDMAYDDTPLPIGEKQTISQPYIVALMTELLEPQSNHIVLEIGTGSGYQAAVLSRIVKKVYTVERIEKLSRCAQRVWEMLGYDNIVPIIADGTDGLLGFAPFDGIIITAAPKELSVSVRNQLKNDAKLVVPIGDGDQRLWIVERKNDKFIEKPNIFVRFVPLISEK
jgi:protein-L-isoaspartate(D-aspartate) O-methyltransferase